MVSKALFQSMSLPASDGNYFLRRDRILGAFALDPNSPLGGYEEAEAALAKERAEDAATKERLRVFQHRMECNGEEVNELQVNLHKQTQPPTRGPPQVLKREAPSSPVEEPETFILHTLM